MTALDTLLKEAEVSSNYLLGLSLDEPKGNASALESTSLEIDRLIAIVKRQQHFINQIQRTGAGPLAFRFGAEDTLADCERIAKGEQ